MHVALVQSQLTSGVVRSLRQPCRTENDSHTVEAVAVALRSGGHTVGVVEGDRNLLSCLESFMIGADGGVAFNLARGIQGESQYAHVPAILEMAGIPYTGSGPLAHAVTHDRVVAKRLIAAAGLPTPAFTTTRTTGLPLTGLRYPLVVKPRRESGGIGARVVFSRTELDAAVDRIATSCDEDALVEEYVDGREVSVALIGNKPVDVLPIVEHEFGMQTIRMRTRPLNSDGAAEALEIICPAPVGAVLGSHVRAIALATFKAVQCRDYARVDLRIDWDGNPWVLGIDSMPGLGSSAPYVLAAEEAGYTYAQLVNRILDVARVRIGTHFRPSAVAPNGRSSGRWLASGESIDNPSSSRVLPVSPDDL